jgi:hypothetical protein
MPNRNKQAFAQDVIFMRQKQREIQAMKDSTAEALVNEAIDTLWLMRDKTLSAKYLADLKNEMDRTAGAAQPFIDQITAARSEVTTKHQEWQTAGTEQEKTILGQALQAAKNIYDAEVEAARLPQAQLIEAKAKYETAVAKAKAKNYADFPGYYETLNTSKDKAEKTAAKENIQKTIKEVTEEAVAEFQAMVDRKALGLPAGSEIKPVTHQRMINNELKGFNVNPFVAHWENIQAALDKNLDLMPSPSKFDSQDVNQKDHRIDPYSEYDDGGLKYDDKKSYFHPLNIKIYFLRNWWYYRSPWKNKNEDIKEEPTHHAEVLQNIKLYFQEKQNKLLIEIPPDEREPGYLDKTVLAWTKASKRRKDNYERITEFNTNANKIYHQTLANYYKSLNPAAVEDDFAENDSKKGKEQNKRAYRFGFEIESTKNELANKKVEQQFLKAGFFITKLFSYAQGVFAAGAWLGVFLFLGSVTNPIVGYVCMASLPLLAFHAARSNWISANDEMGPSLKNHFYNPAHVNYSFGKKLWLWFRHSELSPAAALRTAKGQANFVAAAFIGVLTVVGGFELAHLIPEFAMVAMGPLGSVIAPALVILPVLAAVTVLIYFVLANGSQAEENRARAKAEKEGKVYLADYKNRLNKLKDINNVTNPLMGYKVGVAVALFGIGSTLVGTIGVWGKLFSAGVPHAGEVVFKVGSLSLSGPATVAAAVSLAVVMVACTGMFVFYRRRTRGSVEQGISKVMGTTFDELKGHKLKSLDLTGVNAPDLKGNAFKTTDSFLFTTHDEKVDAQTSRIVNAVAQAGPAILGAMLFFTLVSCGAAALVGGDLVVASGIGIAAGVMAGIAAAAASYSANSTGNRQPKENITDVEVLAQDEAALNEVAKDYENSPFRELGNDRYAAVEYMVDRNRQNAFDGIGLSIRKGNDKEGYQVFRSHTKDQKLDATTALIETTDAIVEMDKPDIMSDRIPVANTHFVRYAQREQNRANASPYENGRLHEIAEKTETALGKISKGVGIGM